jgi:inositol transport system ATP-binding protein
MDEPTASLSGREITRLFEQVRRLKREQITILFISHKLDEIFQIADEITVLRDGAIVGTKPASELVIDDVIAMMVGRRMENKYPYEHIEKGETLLDVKNFKSAGVFSDVSFHVDAGEIVGFAGLMGAGRTEVVRALFGLDPHTAGEGWGKGKKLSALSVRNSIDNGMVMLSEDRRRFGLVPIRSVLENVSLANLKRFIFKGRLHRKQEQSTVSETCARMNVKTPTLETTVEALSGGNQQKIVLAKWMIVDPDILMMDEPTRGIDVGAKYEIYKLMIELARGVETNLLTAFHGEDRGMFARVSRLEASDTATMERLAAIEARMLELERRLPPTA